MSRLVDNPCVTQARPNSIPLPCVLLALSVAVCIGSAGPAEASAMRGAASAQAEQRETLEHLLGAIQQAAKKLTDQLAGQSAEFDQRPIGFAVTLDRTPTSPVGDVKLTVLFLREALLNLPPPSC